MNRRTWTRSAIALTIGLALALGVVSPAIAAPRRDADALLAQRPFAPSDTSLFSNVAYPKTPPNVPAAGPAPSEAQLASRLTLTLLKMCPRRVAEGVRLFAADRQIRAQVPDQNLRAALAVLLCTVGEPAIPTVRSGIYGSIAFGPIPTSGPLANAIAFVTNGPNGKPAIIFNERYRFEDFRLLADTFFHETLHQDQVVSQKEELTNGALNLLVAAQLKLAEPRLATSGTELARRGNTALMARINSGSGSRVGLFTANGPDIQLRDSLPDLPSFAAAYGPLGSDTPGSAALAQVLRNIAGRGSMPPVNPDFDDMTLDFIDRNQFLTSGQVLEVARILRLELPRV